MKSLFFRLGINQDIYIYSIELSVAYMFVGVEASILEKTIELGTRALLISRFLVKTIDQRLPTPKNKGHRNS